MQGHMKSLRVQRTPPTNSGHGPICPLKVVHTSRAPLLSMQRPHRHLARFREERDKGTTSDISSVTPSIAKDKIVEKAVEQPVEPAASAAGEARPTTTPLAAAAVTTPQYSADFIRRRLVVFAAMVVGYSCFYITRNSLTYTAPVMVADPALGFDITMIGTMTSIFPIAYGFSKFVSGVLGARFSATVLLGAGLMATAAINIAFGFGTSLAWFCACWALNGMLQGVGAPTCAMLLTNWFASKERGTYWGMWNIAHNLGGFAAPLVAGGFAKAMGWRWGMFAPGIIGVAVGVFVLAACRDRPEDLGYPPVESAAARPAASASGAAAAPKPKVNIWAALMNVLKNPYVVGLALTYFFVYVVRQGVTSWMVFYLMKAKGVADAAEAAVRVSGLELGGLAGSLVAGKLSDYLISKGSGGNVGKRIRVVLAYTVGIAASLMAMQTVPASLPALQWLNVFMIGFFLYGPQMLIGLCGAELVDPASVGASQGFLGWVAYLGAANAGIPLSFIVKQYGWGAYFTALVAACGMAALLLAPMVNLRSHVERKAAAAIKKAA